MPNIVYASNGGGLQKIASIGSASFDYDYPNKLDLKPDSELSKFIVGQVLDRARISNGVFSSRYAQWKEIDRTLTAYVDLTDKEKEQKEAGNNKPVSIVIPVSYATLDILMTYWVAAFLVEPYFKYEGASPEDMQGAFLLTQVVAKQCAWSKAALALYTMWRDSFAYGFGGVHIGFQRTMATRKIETPETFTSKLTGSIMKKVGLMKEETVDYVRHEGSVLTPLDPYMCLPDPNSPIHDIASAEFFGWVEDTNLVNILKQEQSDNGEGYFNAKYLKLVDARSIYNQRAATGRDDKSQTYNRTVDITKPADVIKMYINIIPKDWKLGKNEYPELWFFAVSGDCIVLDARRVTNNHGGIPVAICAPDFDGHSTTPISRIEVTYGLQETIDWEVKSHIANVTSIINNTLVVDPYLINMNDVKKRKEGGIIRLRADAFGKSVKDAVYQLNVHDVTSGNIQDVMFLMDILNKVSGSLDAISGVRRRTSERVSATEASDVKDSALSRLEKAAKISSIQAHMDIANQMASNSLQYMSKPVYAKVLGDYANMFPDNVGGRVLVNPEDIDVDYDIIPQDGTMPNTGDVQLWSRLFEIMSAHPEVAQQFNTVNVFKHIALLAGAKDVDRFANPAVTVAPQQEIDRGVQEGNFVPVNQMGEV